MVEPRPKKRLVVGGLIILCVIAIGLETARRMGQTQVRTVTGTIVQLDAQTRHAAIEIIHPKTGKPLRIEGTAPPECDIQVDGKPATLAELRVGDRARVEGVIHRDMTVTANWVHVSRNASSPARQPPASQPLAGP
jgi:hypothetical protein